MESTNDWMPLVGVCIPILATLVVLIVGQDERFAGHPLNWGRRWYRLQVGTLVPSLFVVGLSKNSVTEWVAVATFYASIAVWSFLHTRQNTSKERMNRAFPEINALCAHLQTGNKTVSAGFYGNLNEDPAYSRITVSCGVVTQEMSLQTAYTLARLLSGTADGYNVLPRCETIHDRWQSFSGEAPSRPLVLSALAESAGQEDEQVSR